MTAGTVRGFDGTGMFFLDAEGKDPTLWLQKEAITGGAMAETVGRGTIDSRFVVGHNRAATIGGVSTETTHPFSFEHVTGVHNGTFRAWRAMWKDSDQSVDSAALYEALDNVGPEEAEIVTVLETLGLGAYALVWYDSRTSELHIARNDERPLYVVTSPSGVWFASEKRMLEWVLDRNGETMFHGFELETETLLTIDTNTGASRYLEYRHDYQSTPAVDAYAGGGYLSRWVDTPLFPLTDAEKDTYIWDDDDEQDKYDRWNKQLGELM